MLSIIYNNIIQATKTMRVVLFTNARDESHIREWAAHHLLQGFDHITIFDHKSKQPIVQDLAGFDKRVTVIDISTMGDSAIKMPLMMRAATIAKQQQADWMLYLDADEFLIVNEPQVKGIKHFLAKHTNSTIDQLAINWLMFGTSGLKDLLDFNKGELISATYTRSDEYLNNHVKCFVRPREVVGASNPHFFDIRRSTHAIGIDGNTFSPPFHDLAANGPHFRPRPFYAAPIFIAHYVFQSEATYRKRKVELPRDDNGGMRGDDVSSIHGQFNVRDNFLVARSTAPLTLAFLRSRGLCA